MHFTVRHETIYRYSAPVSLSPHLLRLNPRAEGATILERSLTVDPKPIAFREETDRFGNRVTHLDFEGFSDRLRIESRFDLETVAPEPFAGLGAPPLPWAGGPDDPMAQYRSGEAQEPAVWNGPRPRIGHQRPNQIVAVGLDLLALGVEQVLRVRLVVGRGVGGEFIGLALERPPKLRALAPSP